MSERNLMLVWIAIWAGVLIMGVLIDSWPSIALGAAFCVIALLSMRKGS